MIHIVIPEGLNRAGAATALSNQYAACLEHVARRAGREETVYLAPGNCFGWERPEDLYAADYLRGRRPDLTVHSLEVSRERYLDTLDNALVLRQHLEQSGAWPVQEVRLYCTHMHAFRSWLCFRLSGFAVDEVMRAGRPKRRGLIAARLRHYDYPAAHFAYEALATCYALARMAGGSIFSGIPALHSRRENS